MTKKNKGGIIIKEIVIDKAYLKFKYAVYDDGSVYNIDSGKRIKPSIDPRRPNQPPYIYFKMKNGKRECWLQDKLIATLFIPEYTNECFIHHKDNNIYNCELINLEVYNGIDILTNLYHETKCWKKVQIDIDLYYNYYICEDGRLFNGSTYEFVQPFLNKIDNYPRFNLYYGKSSNDVIHFAQSRLVALHFIPKPEGKDIVIFKDNNNKNVDASNLYWGDRYDVINKNIETDRSFSCLYNPLLGKEKWKTIEIDGLEFVDEYIISNFGRVYNKTKKFYPHVLDARHHNACNQHYKLVFLNVVGKNTFRYFYIHRLVAFAFVKNDNPKEKIFINHINGNPECNLAINLEFVRPIDNIHHAINTNLIHNNTSKYTDYVDQGNWRLNTLLAWIYSFKNITDMQAYRFYQFYIKTFKDDFDTILSFDEFVNEFNYRKENNEDFKNLFEFYKSNYQIELN